MSARAVNRKTEESRARRRFGSERVVSEITGRGVRTLQKDRIYHRGFPYYRLGRQVLYDLDEIIGILEKSRVEVLPGDAR